METDTKFFELGSFPFALEWIQSMPHRVEEILGQTPVEEQIRLAMQLPGQERLDLLMLSPKGIEVVRAMPPEEIHYMIKHLGPEQCFPVLSVLSTDQVQYLFDVEWWYGDTFIPERAIYWLHLFDQCEEPKVLEWLLTEEFDQKVMLLQSLILVRKRDEMTDDYQNTEDMPTFTLDGVYDIFLKVPDIEPVLKKNFKLLRENNEKVYFSLLEAVIWYPVTPTLEKAYQWRVVRTGERGIPELEEAISVYSRLDPESLKEDIPEPDYFGAGGKYRVAPVFPLFKLSATSFFGQCLKEVDNRDRLEALRWELVYLANKVLVADKVDPTLPDSSVHTMKKVLGYVNIGLELGAKGDPVRGTRILERSWMQSLFQVGFGRLLQVSWQAKNLVKDQGALLPVVLTETQNNQLKSLIGRFPKIWRATSGEGLDAEEDFESMAEVLDAERFLAKCLFQARFTRHCLDLQAESMRTFLESMTFPENVEDLDIQVLVNTSLANHVLYKELVCEPISTMAVQPFINMLYITGATQELPAFREDLIRAYFNRLLEVPMAWSDEDRTFLNELLDESLALFHEDFRALTSRRINWNFIRCLAVKELRE